MSDREKIGICINARISSSRCPRKLVRSFFDTTLIDIALDKLSKINAYEKCLAAGDEELFDIYEKYSDDIKLLKRLPDAVASGEHHHSVSFRHYNDMESDFILIMNPCLPFTSVKTYEEAIRFFESSDCKSLTSVLSFKDIFFNKDGDVITLPNVHHVSSTTADTLYKMAHIFHIIDKNYFMREGKVWSYEDSDPSLFEVPYKECFDVDNEEEFEFCRNLYEKGMR